MKLQSPLFVGNKGNVCGKMPLQADNAPTINLFCFFKEGNGRHTNIKRAVPVSLGLGPPWSAMSDLAHLSTIFLCDSLDLVISMIRKLRDYLVGRLTRSYQISTVWDS